MQKFTFLFFFCLLFCLSSQPGLAGECKGCLVVRIGSGPDFSNECRSGACVLVRLENKVGELSRSNCSSGGNWQYALDISTDRGKARLEILKEALNDRSYVDILGDDRCTVYSSRTIEDLGQVKFTVNPDKHKKKHYDGW